MGSQVKRVPPLSSVDNTNLLWVGAVVVGSGLEQRTKVIDEMLKNGSPEFKRALRTLRTAVVGLDGVNSVPKLVEKLNKRKSKSSKYAAMALRYGYDNWRS